MVKTLFLVLVVCSFTSKAQDSLRIERKVFTSAVFEGYRRVSDHSLQQKLVGSRKWSNKFLAARFLLPASPVVVGTGVYLGYDAIKGIPMEAEINGKIYPYTKRSLPKLLGGLAVFAVGISLLESANETKHNAVAWYNKSISATNPKISKMHIDLKWLEWNRVGLVISY